MLYSDVLKNEHFNNLATLIRGPFLSPDWKRRHPQVAFWGRIADLNKIKTSQYFARNRAEFVAQFCAMLSELTGADPDLIYTAADLDWFVSAMDKPDALAIVGLLFAYFSAPVSDDSRAES